MICLPPSHAYMLSQSRVSRNSWTSLAGEVSMASSAASSPFSISVPSTDWKSWAMAFCGHLPHEVSLQTMRILLVHLCALILSCGIGILRLATDWHHILGRLLPYPRDPEECQHHQASHHACLLSHPTQTLADWLLESVGQVGIRCHAIWFSGHASFLLRPCMCNPLGSGSTARSLKPLLTNPRISAASLLKRGSFH